MSGKITTPEQVEKYARVISLWQTKDVMAVLALQEESCPAWHEKTIPVLRAELGRRERKAKS